MKEAPLAGPARALAFLAAISGCTSTVKPPESPADPVVVFLRSEARHRGLVLPGPNGTFVEYGYGDYDWYALSKDSWYQVFDTILWPTPGTLGRRFLTASSLSDPGRYYPSSRFESIRVERRRAAELEAELSRSFRDRESEIHLNAEYEMEFVPYPDRFWFGHNCHDATAEWLRELGCTVSRTPIRGGLELIDAPARSTTPPTLP